MEESLAFHNVILIVSCSGFLGGAIAALMGLVSSDHYDVDDYYAQHKMACVTTMGAIGIGGSFGAVLLSLWGGKLPLTDSVESMTSLAGLCIISGIFATRFIPLIGDKIEKDLYNTITKETSKKTKSAVILSADYSSAINFAYTAIDGGNEKDIEDAISRLEKLKESFPKDRALYILLGRLYRGIKNYDKAILTLREFVKNINKDLSKKGHSVGIEEACGDAYYNIACYHAIKATLEDGPEQDRLKKEACQEAERSFTLWPKNKAYASDDSDFDSIRNTPQFSRLIDDE